MAAVTVKVKMISTAVHAAGKRAGKRTGYYKTTTKNPRNHPEKMKLIMFDPRVRQHVEFVEGKVK